MNYGEAIRSAFEYLLENHEEVFTIGQGLWSPWYVGNSMTDLDARFGKERVMDTPVSEQAVTGVALGASLSGYRPIVIHPRIDFMLLASDQIVNQAAKWHHMMGGRMKAPLTIRGIINRGGEQGAQHSQALHSWYCHIPGLKVVMPSTVADARDLLIASVLDDSPVVYIDDRWLYDNTADLKPAEPLSLSNVEPQLLSLGEDITFVAASYASHQCQQAATELNKLGISAEVVDMRMVNPLIAKPICDSVEKTGRLLVVDGGWSNCGLAGEVIARVSETLNSTSLKSKPVRITLTDAPAPSSRTLEQLYYTEVNDIVNTAKRIVEKKP